MKKWGLFILVLMICWKSNAQPYLRYQGVLRNAANDQYLNKSFVLKISIHSDSANGTIAWQETQSLVTSPVNGRFVALVGSGTSTGVGTFLSFDDLQWAQHVYFISLEIDIDVTGNFTSYGNTSLFSVPYAMFAQTADVSNTYFLNALNDVDTSGIQTDDILKWNGVSWVIAGNNQEDTASYAISSGNAVNSDTANYVVNFPVDSVAYSYYSDTTVYAGISQNSDSTSNASYADTAGYVLVSSPYTWVTSGNMGTNVLGTNDNSSFVFRAFNIPRLTIGATGGITNSVSSPSGFYLSGDDFLLHISNNPAAGNIGISGAGTRLSYTPFNGAFRYGTAIANEWDSLNLGFYSMAVGQNVIAGDYAFTIGQNNIATGDNAIVFGRGCSGTALGILGNGTSFCVGDSSMATGVRTVVMGRKCHSANTTAVSIGYKATALANVSTAIGSNVKTTTGLYSMILGSYASGANRQGCFVYGDASSTSFITPTANHQMLIRASGGIYLYSDALHTSGVILMPGSGSWSMVSDRNKKENFEEVNYEDVLAGIAKLNLQQWNYKSQFSGIKHLGPTAQNFYKAFRLGESKKRISMIDIDGIIMAGGKGIYLRHEKFKTAMDETNVLSKDLKGDFDTLEKRIEKLEEELKNNK